MAESSLPAVSPLSSNPSKRCRNVACPIKDLLASPDQEIGARATCMSIAVLDIPRLDLPAALFHAPTLSD